MEAVSRSVATTSTSAQAQTPASSAEQSVAALLALPSSRPGTGADRVVALLRLYARLLLSPLDVMLLDALLLGPFAFGRGGGSDGGGGATVLQLSSYLGVIPRLIYDSLKGGPLATSGIVISTLSLPGGGAGPSRGSDDDSDSDGDDSDTKEADNHGVALAGGVGGVGVRKAKALGGVRYMVSFGRAVPFAYAHLSRVFMAVIKRPTDGSIDVDAPTTSTTPSAPSGGGGGNSSVAASRAAAASGSGGGGRYWYCFKCKEWLPQLSAQRQIKAICHCGACGGNILAMAAAEARLCFEALRGTPSSSSSASATAPASGKTPASASTSAPAQQQQQPHNPQVVMRGFSTPQRWLVTLFRDPSLLQQLLAFCGLFASRLRCTSLSDVALSPADWATEEEVAALEHHAAAGGLVSAGTANLFRLQHAHSGHRPVRVTFALAKQRDAEAARQNALKVSKRSTLPPWMAPPEAKEAAAAAASAASDTTGGAAGALIGGEIKMEFSSDATPSAAGGKRPREDGGGEEGGLSFFGADDDSLFGSIFGDGGSGVSGPPPPASTSSIVSSIARATLSDKYIVVDL